MVSDHAKLDQLWAEFMAETHSAQNAARLFQQFSDHIVKHMDLEDNVLFPLFDKHTGLEGGIGPTALVRRDHANILKLMETVKKTAATKDINKIQYASNHLQRALNAHRERENQMQYPVLDNVVNDGKWFEILKRIYG